MINSLELTVSQEVELKSIINMVYKICFKYIDKLSVVHLLEYDDLVQIALLKLLIAIKSESCKDNKCKTSYYRKIIQNACLDELRKAKYRNSIIIGVDDSSFENTPIEDDDIEKLLSNTEYVNIILSYIKSDYCKEIFIHYYGIGTYSKNCKEIGILLKKPSVAIRLAKGYTIKKIKEKIISNQKKNNKYAGKNLQ